MILRGVILDKTTGQPVPGASVVIVSDTTYMGIGTAANAQGEFYLNTGSYSDGYYLQVSSIGYQTVKDALYDDYNIDWSGKVLLQRMNKDLPPVVVTSNKKNLSWLLLLALPFIIKNDKKRVGAIDNSTIMTIGLAFVVLQGMGLLSQLLHSLGLGTSPGGGEQSDTNSPWKPDYWKTKASAERRQYMKDHFGQYYDSAAEIYNALGIFTDNWVGVMNQFNQFHTKADISYLSYMFAVRYNGDMLTFLKTGTINDYSAPWDGLSDAHLQILLNYVDHLPVT